MIFSRVMGSLSLRNLLDDSGRLHFDFVDDVFVHGVQQQLRRALVSGSATMQHNLAGHRIDPHSLFHELAVRWRNGNHRSNSLFHYLVVCFDFSTVMQDKNKVGAVTKKKNSRKLQRGLTTWTCSKCVER